MESTSSPSGFLSSPRAQRRLLFAGGTVFGIGLVALISVVLLRGTSGIHSPISTKAAQTAPKEIKAPPPKSALKVARLFVETAPLRKNLDRVYEFVAPSLKGNLTRGQWAKGNIPVIDYPAGNAKTAAFVVDWSYRTQIMLEVDLVAKKGSPSNIRPHLPFFLGLERKGDKPNGQWQVNVWVPVWHPPIPMAQ
jgi:hypothetical protein